MFQQFYLIIFSIREFWLKVVQWAKELLLLERRKYLDFLEVFSLSFSSSWKHFVSSSMGPGQHDSFFYLLFISEISAQLLGWTKNSLSRNLVIVIFCSHGRISTSLRQISGYAAVDFQEYSVKQLPQMLLLNGWSRFTLNFIPWYNKIKSIRIQETCYMYDSFTPFLLIWQVIISF